MGDVVLQLGRPLTTTGDPVSYTQDILARGWGVHDVHRTLNCDYSDALDNSAGYSGGIDWDKMPEDNVRLIFTPGNVTSLTVSANNYIARWWKHRLLIDRIEIDHGATVPGSLKIYTLQPGADPLDPLSWTEVATVTGSANVVHSLGIVSCGLKIEWLGAADVLRWSAYIDHVDVIRKPGVLKLGSNTTGPTMRWSLDAAYYVTELRWYQTDLLVGTNFTKLRTSFDGQNWKGRQWGNAATVIIGPSPLAGLNSSPAPQTDFIAAHSLNYITDNTPSFVVSRLWDGSGNRVQLTDGAIPYKFEFSAAHNQQGGTGATNFDIWFVIVRPVSYNGLKKYVLVSLFCELASASLSTTFANYTVPSNQSDITAEALSWRLMSVEPGDLIGVWCETNNGGPATGWYFNTDPSLIDPRNNVAYGRWDPGAVQEVKVVSGWNTDATYQTLTAGNDADPRNDINLQLVPYLKADINANVTHIEVTPSNDHDVRDMYWGELEVIASEDSGFGIYMDSSAVTPIPTNYMVFGVPGDIASTPITTLYLKNETGADVSSVEIMVDPNGDAGTPYLEVSLNNAFNQSIKHCTNNPGAPSVCMANNANWLSASSPCNTGCGVQCTVDNGIGDDGYGLDGSNPPTDGWGPQVLIHAPSSPISSGSVFPIYVRARIPSGASVTAAPCALIIRYWV